MENNFERIIQLDGINMPYRKHEHKREHFRRKVRPELVNYQRLRKTKHLRHMIWHPRKEQYYMTDKGEHVIKIAEKDLNTPNMEIIQNDNKIIYKHCGINPKQKLHCPVGICLNSRLDVFVACHGNGKNSDERGIFVFNQDLTEHIGSIGVNNEVLNTPSCMDIENFEDGYRLYVTDWYYCNITVWKVSFNDTNQIKYNGELLKKKIVMNPSVIRIKNDYLFVISEVTWVMCENNDNVKLNQVNNMLTGLNAILIFNKSTLEHIKMIDLTCLQNFAIEGQLTSWIGPQGLTVDDELNMYTTAYKFNDVIDENTEISIAELNEKFFKLDVDNNPVPRDESESNELTQLFKQYHSRLIKKSYSENMHLVKINFEGKEVENKDLYIEFIGDFYMFNNVNNIGHKMVCMSGRKDPALHLVEFR